MKVATCTPVDFTADPHFFGRDSGLLCRGFQAAGVPCVSVMPGRSTPADAPDLVRCSMSELADAKWWRGLGLDLVVLYAWGDPAHRPVADAIREAGIRLIQSLDTAGLTSPYGDTREWWQCLTGMLASSQPLPLKFRHLAKAMRDFFPGLYETRRLAMINQSDRVASVSPAAVLSIRNYATSLGYPGIAAKTILVPHPIPPAMSFHEGIKENIVLAVGRWEQDDSAQKDPDLMLAVLKSFLSSHPEWSAEIIGRGGTALVSRCVNWSPQIRDRLVLTEAVDRDALAVRYASSKILLCASRFESFHISSAEAVCCGCSLVVADHPLLASTAWFTTEDTGTLVANRSVESLVTGLTREAEAWHSGQRNPHRISERWSTLLHAHHVATHILDQERCQQAPIKLDHVLS